MITPFAADIDGTHHIDNCGSFETGPSRFATGMVLRIPARVPTMWQ